MSSGRKNVRNLVINWSSFGLTFAVLFFLSPFVIHSLGAVDYGIWSLLTVLTGYMGILDLGIRASTGRHIYLYMGRDDHKAVDETIRTSLALYSWLGFLIFAVAILLGWLFPLVVTSIPEKQHSLLKWLVPLMAINVWSGAIASIFTSVIVAHERFDLARGVDVAILIVRTAGTVAVLQSGMRLEGMVWVVIGCNLISLIANYFLAKRIYPRLQVTPFKIDRFRLHELWTFGVGAFLISVAGKVIGQTDLFIVGAVIGVEEVTVYSVGAMLVFYSTLFVQQIDVTFHPSLQKAAARNEWGTTRWIFLRQLRMSALVAIPMCVGFMMFSEPFIRLWMLGPEFDEDSVQRAAGVMSILAAARLLSAFYAGSGPLLTAVGKVRLPATISVCEAVMNLVLSLLLLFFFQRILLSVALGTLLSRLFVTTFTLPWLACQNVQISFIRYLYDIGARNVAAILIFAAGCYVAQTLIPPQANWAQFFASVILALLVYIPISLIVLIPKADRVRVQNWIRKSPAWRMATQRD